MPNKIGFVDRHVLDGHQSIAIDLKNPVHHQKRIPVRQGLEHFVDRHASNSVFGLRAQGMAFSKGGAFRRNNRNRCHNGRSNHFPLRNRLDGIRHQARHPAVDRMTRLHCNNMPFDMGTG